MMQNRKCKLDIIHRNSLPNTTWTPILFSGYAYHAEVSPFYVFGPKTVEKINKQKK